MHVPNSLVDARNVAAVIGSSAAFIALSTQGTVLEQWGAEGTHMDSVALPSRVRQGWAMPVLKKYLSSST